MVKLLAVIARRPDLTHAEFIKHLSTTHLQVVDRVPEFRNRVREYMQNHVFIDPLDLASVKTLAPATNADAILEILWDSVADARAAFGEPRYLEIIRPDELAFGDVAGAWGVTTKVTYVRRVADFAGPIKAFVFLKREQDLTHSEFYRRWIAVRDGLIISAPRFTRLVSRFVENMVEQDVERSLPGARPFDLVVELWFESFQQIAEFSDDTGMMSSVIDVEGYVDSSATRIYVAQAQPASAEWLRRSQVGTPGGRPRSPGYGHLKLPHPLR